MAEEKKTGRDLQNSEQEQPKTEQKKPQRPMTREEIKEMVRLSIQMFSDDSEPTITPKKKADSENDQA